MGNEIFSAMGLSLGLTLLSELLLCLVLGYRSGRVLLMVILANILTNPAVVLCFWLLTVDIELAPLPVTLLLELCAVAVEWLCYKFRAKELEKPFFFSLFLNGSSYFLGFILQRFLR